MTGNVSGTWGRAKILTPEEIATVSGGTPRLGGQIPHLGNATQPFQIRQAPPTPAPTTQETYGSEGPSPFTGIGSVGDMGVGGFGGIGGLGGMGGS